jgi:indolepyruvate ferredoxin oxidoreductase alpha subunit
VDNRARSTKNPIERALRGVGVNWVKPLTRTYDIPRMRESLKEALTTRTGGPKVIIAQSECMLTKQRRIRPQVSAAIKAGKRMVHERFGVDADTCTGDHSCIRLSGCPSLSVKPSADPLRTDPVAHVDNSCVGCGLCGEISHAAVLCPSFYRARIVTNPTRIDRIGSAIRSFLIGFLQGRTDRALARRAF